MASGGPPYYGRWSVNDVYEAVLDGTWVAATPEDPANTGGVLMSPTSIAYTGTSASINTRGSVSFTACSSLSLNGVFTADYDYYQIIIRQDNSAEAYLNYRLRASGTDNSTANSYVSQILYGDNTTVGASRVTTDKGYICYLGSVQRNGVTLNVYGPYLAQPTAWRGIGADDYLSAEVLDVAGTHNQSTAYDGFTLLPTTGALDGLVSVYGLKG